MWFKHLTFKIILGFQKCADKIKSIKDNSVWNGAVYTLLDEEHNFTEAKAACKDYNARIMSVHEEIDVLKNKTLEALTTVKLVDS